MSDVEAGPSSPPASAANPAAAPPQATAAAAAAAAAAGGSPRGVARRERERERGNDDDEDDDDPRGRSRVGAGWTLEELVAAHAAALLDRLTRELVPYFAHLDTKTWLRRVVHAVVPRVRGGGGATATATATGATGAVSYTHLTLPTICSG